MVLVPSRSLTGAATANDRLGGRSDCLNTSAPAERSSHSIEAPVASSIRYFKDEYLAHQRHGGCPFEGSSSLEGILAPSDQHAHTPAGEERTLDITVSSVQTPDTEVLGAACLINDRTEMTRIHRQVELRGEMSAGGMADQVQALEARGVAATFLASLQLAERLSTLANAPRGLVGQLAHDDEIAIAGPLLRRSPLIDEKMLIEIASEKGQDHLLAMAERPTLSADLTDVIVARGDRKAVRRAAGNAGAAFSEDSYSTLIKRAGQDGVLTIRLGQRDDLSSDQLKELLSGSIDVIRRRLFQVVKPERQVEIKQAMTVITGPTEREERRELVVRAGEVDNARAGKDVAFLAQNLKTFMEAARKRPEIATATSTPTTTQLRSEARRVPWNSRW